MIKSLKYLLLGSLVLFVLLGCNFGNDVIENSNTGSNDVNNSGSTNDTVTGSALTITNNSGKTVCSVYVTLQDATEWGDERLGTEVLNQGDSKAIQVADGNYRVRTNDCDGDLIAEYNDFEVDGSTSLTVEDRTVGSTLAAGGPAGTLSVVNNSSEDVCYVFVSPTDATSWGNDQLGDNEIVGPGESATLMVTAGLYDLQAADCDGNALAEQYDVDLNTGQTWTLQ
ncbi:MAG: hypothetical protein WAM60_11990 [Candidatus Promineifilaceae bacterium]